MSSTGDNERAHDDADAQAAQEAQEWQAIVDNYGDRALLDEPAAAAPTPAPEPAPEPVVVQAAPYSSQERFVPPPPPPIPRPEPRRAIAWAGLVGAPLLALVALVLHIDLAPIVRFALVGWFVGGFAYLVATMGQNPRDPWDDGSRV